MELSNIQQKKIPNTTKMVQLVESNFGISM